MDKRSRITTGVIGAIAAALIGVSAWFLANPILELAEAPSQAVIIGAEAEGQPSEGVSLAEDEGADWEEGHIGPSPSGSETPTAGFANGGSPGSSQGEPSLESPDFRAGAGASSPQSASTIDVSIIITSSEVGSPVSSSTKRSLPSGATAYDGLLAASSSVGVSDSGYGKYVTSIDGLAQGQYGPSSGWMYSVNGQTPMTSCSSYQLSSGDVLTWYYVR